MAVALYARTSPPVDGRDQVEWLTFEGAPDGGTFRLQVLGWETADIDWDADPAVLAAAITSAIEAIAAIGAGAVTVTEDEPVVGSFTITFTGNLARTALDPLVIADDSLTGTDAAVGRTMAVAGVTPDPLYPPNGALAVDGTAPAALYVNCGTQTEPSWYPL